jgi:hypothetical protein
MSAIKIIARDTPVVSPAQMLEWKQPAVSQLRCQPDGQVAVIVPLRVSHEDDFLSD